MRDPKTMHAIQNYMVVTVGYKWVGYKEITTFKVRVPDYVDDDETELHAWLLTYMAKHVGTSIRCWIKDKEYVKR